MSDPNYVEKKRREVLRWRILQTLEISHPYKFREDMLLATVGGPDMPITQADLRREIVYLEKRELVEISGRGMEPCWLCELSYHGLDIAQYTAECFAGIARPEKYW